MNAKVYILSVILSGLSLTSGIEGCREHPWQNDLAPLQGRWTARTGARREVQILLS